jgi:NADH:ubiquinone oxidoreductase subunit F (NADH-binding)
MSDLFFLLQEEGLVGRGGASYPVWKKWEAVRQAAGTKKYVIGNASEGEPGVYKDAFILQEYPDKVFEGLRLAMDFIGAKEAILYLKHSIYEDGASSLEYQARQARKQGKEISFYKKEPSYIGGEETALLNVIEGKRAEPRLKPPYPAQSGLFGCPTLVQNVETLFDIACLAEGVFAHERFYSICEQGKLRGVFHFPDDWSVRQILEEAACVPSYDFFVQVGGSASGAVYGSDQTGMARVGGAGSIEIYPLALEPKELLGRWFDFYTRESCGKCAPCKMGTYNLARLLRESSEIPWQDIMEIVETMEQTSFCALGASIAVPIKTYRRNILGLS